MGSKNFLDKDNYTTIKIVFKDVSSNAEMIGTGCIVQPNLVYRHCQTPIFLVLNRYQVDNSESIKLSFPVQENCTNTWDIGKEYGIGIRDLHNSFTVHPDANIDLALAEISEYANRHFIKALNPFFCFDESGWKQMTLRWADDSSHLLFSSFVTEGDESGTQRTRSKLADIDLDRKDGIAVNFHDDGLIIKHPPMSNELINRDLFVPLMKFEDGKGRLFGFALNATFPNENEWMQGFEQSADLIGLSALKEVLQVALAQKTKLSGSYSITPPSKPSIRCPRWYSMMPSTPPSSPVFSP